MNIIPQNAIKTEYGFRLSKNGSCFHYQSTSCIECGKITYKERRGYRISKNSFCSKLCQANFRHKQIDPLGANILLYKDQSDFYYLMGLICTDGHITYPPNYVHYSCSISLMKSDSQLLDKIYKKFGGRININKHDVRWLLNNEKFVSYLKEMGLTHNKTFSLNITKWFNGLSNFKKAHFMRGVIDGDGSIIKNAQNLWRVCLVSASINFIKLCADYFKCNFYKDRNTYCIQINKRKEIQEILERIYSNAGLFLDRKYNKYQQLLKENNAN